MPCTILWQLLEAFKQQLHGKKFYIPDRACIKGLWSSSMPPQARALENKILSGLPPALKPLGFKNPAFFKDFSEKETTKFYPPVFSTTAIKTADVYGEIRINFSSTN